MNRVLTGMLAPTPEAAQPAPTAMPELHPEQDIAGIPVLGPLPQLYNPHMDPHQGTNEHPEPIIPPAGK